MSALPAARFDTDLPWGACAPRPWHARLLALSHRLPGGAAWRRLVPVLRRPMRYGVDHALDVTVWGLRLRLAPRGNKAEERLLFAPQYFDIPERDFLAGQLAPGGSFVDVGANVGAYTYWAHRCMRGQGRIVAVEPDPEMHRRLQFNLRTNGLAHVQAVDAALSDHTGEADLFVKPEQRGSNSLQPMAGDTSARVAFRVALRTLVDVVQGSGLTSIDALKIDIEGLEPPVLGHFFAHAPQSLWPRAILVELRHDTEAQLLELLQRCGYRVVLRSRLNVAAVRPADSGR